ncbi:hypothetical protein P689_122137 [Candidatus Riesia pediculischaeffi PTSU]|uniref:Uncharacterized protein n=1 Tax=Candidatus Riesia pediculischaeffi PTSU TaxID=1401651 RepID=A0A0C1V7Z4_9ENTR|nr:hypothetical protein P689_122137 [Candidatus Riesia pediculischaeffi PTSU]
MNIRAERLLNLEINALNIHFNKVEFQNKILKYLSFFLNRSNEQIK